MSSPTAAANLEATLEGTAKNWPFARSDLVAYYEKHDPSKVGTVDHIMATWTPEELVPALTKKYNDAPAARRKVEVIAVPAADGSIKGDEDKEIVVAIKQAEDRIGMHPKSAICRALLIHLLVACAYGVYGLVIPQFFTKYAFDGDIVPVVWYLAARATFSNAMRSYTTSVFGHISDRTTRRGWMVFSQLTAAVSIIVCLGIFAYIGQVPLQVMGIICVIIDLPSPAWDLCMRAFAKDIVPEHLYNSAEDYHPCHPRYLYTKIGIDALIQICGTLGFFFGNVIGVVLVIILKAETTNMFAGGAFHLLAAVLIMCLLPESIDPEFSKNNSVWAYLTSKECREKDLNVFRSFRVLIKGVQSPVMKALFLFWFLEMVMAAQGSVMIQYLTYRWGMGAAWLIVLFLVGGFVAFPSVLAAPLINGCIGEVNSASIRNLLMFFFYIYNVWNTQGVIYYVPYAFCVGLLFFGQVTLWSWLPRLADYHQQGELEGYKSSMASWAQAICRFAFAGLWDYGAKNTELVNYGGSQNVPDCSDDDKVKHWCSAPSDPTAADVDSFSYYGPAYGLCAGKGATCEIPQTQGVWQLKDGMTATAGSRVTAGSACNVNDSADPLGEHECFCLWKETRCRTPVDADASIGGAFDPLAAFAYLSAVVAVISLLWWIYIAFVVKPVAAMQKRREQEVAQWRDRTFKEGDGAARPV